MMMGFWEFVISSIQSQKFHHTSWNESVPFMKAKKESINIAIAKNDYVAKYS